jgi:predicted oxidoreductase
VVEKRTWVDLTDTQIEQVYFDVVKEHRGAPMPWGQVQFGRALLDKFKEVNT